MNEEILRIQICPSLEVLSFNTGLVVIMVLFAMAGLIGWLIEKLAPPARRWWRARMRAAERTITPARPHDEF